MTEIKPGWHLAPHQVTVLRQLACCDDHRFRALDPAEPYAENRFPVRGDSNPVYGALRSLLMSMGLDAARYGQADWNPLGEILHRGQRVVVKPNLVFHKHYKGGSLHTVVTDPRLIRAVCDFVFQAIGEEGEIILGDAPLQSADWDALIASTGLNLLPDFYGKFGLRLSLVDFRTLATTDVRGLKCSPRPLAGDIHGYKAVDFGAHSLHAGRDWRRFRVTNYNPEHMLRHHNAETHEYLISGSILTADAVINLPKLKTHRKSGLTCALKNMVGINGCKDWLPHHSVGGTDRGGDEYHGSSEWKRFTSWMVEREEETRSFVRKFGWNTARKLFWKIGSTVTEDVSWEGSWHGNDTLWRTILDLNRAARYADQNGHLQEEPQRAILTIADAILAGEGEGPMAPSPVPMGCLIGSMNPLAAEIAACRLAQWPQQILKTVDGAFPIQRYPLAGFDRSQLDIACSDMQAGQIRPVPLSTISRFLTPPRGFQQAFSRQAIAAGTWQ